MIQSPSRISGMLLTILLSLARVVGNAALAADAEKPISVPKPVKFLEYKEIGDWTTWKDERLSIRIPSSWSVRLVEDQIKNDHWTYALLDDKRAEVFQVSIVKGGPEWIGCFCAPQADYEYSEIPPYRVWTLTMDMGDDLKTRTVKVANKELRLDIHAALFKVPNEVNEDRAPLKLTQSEAELRRYVAESARVNH